MEPLSASSRRLPEPSSNHTDGDLPNSNENDGANDEDSKAVQIPKTIGLASSITIIVGSIIGSGIFVSPRGILAQVRSIGASLIIWVACGIFSMLGAFCYAELGTMIVRSGGDYVYVYEAFGPFLGFLRLWVEVIVVRPTSVAVIALAFGKYVIQPVFPTCDEPDILVRLLACLCILILGFANAISLKLSTRIQDVFTYAKLAALVMIIVTGFVQLGRGRFEGLVDAFADSNWNPSAIATAFYNGLFAYSGWNYLNCMIEEMKNPRRDLPLAISISCILVTLIYTMANVAYATVMTTEEIIETTAVAITFANRMYGVMWWIMPIFVACSTFGGVNGTIMTTSRMFYVASQLEQMPKFLSFLHETRLTPITSVIFTCLISIIYIFMGDIYTLISYVGFVQWLAIGLGVFIVISFRITRKHQPRPVKAPLIFAIVYVAITLFLVVYSFVGSPFESLMGTIIILTGIPVYVVGCMWKNKPESFRRKFHSITIGIQKLLRVLPSD